jgi:hypothetical protein
VPSAADVFACAKRFSLRDLTRGGKAFCDIIHFQHDRVYPFSQCYVYCPMKENIIPSSELPISIN